MIQIQQNEVLIQLGHGDISIETGEDADGRKYLSFVGVQFNDEHPIPVSKVVIESISPESIDVLISKLFWLKGIAVPIPLGDSNVTIIDVDADSAPTDYCSCTDRIHG